MTDIELMQQALDALEQVAEYFSDDSTEAKTITALRERLAQPEQEPVATLDDLEQEIYENTRQFVSRDVMEWMLKRYYTTPPQRKPLTDEEIMNLCASEWASHPIEVARIIEAAHGITGEQHG